MVLTPQAIADTYRKRAKRYDLTANLYYLIGFREYRYRRQAVAALQLRPGDTVIELGCGTGLNFALLLGAVGPTGRVIGVDLTEAMLERAQRRIDANGWRNVELVHSDVAAYEFPSIVDGVISTFAITLSSEYDRAIEHAAAALAAQRHCVILDLKRPNNAPPWLVNLGLAITRPFGVSLDMTKRHPWESLERHMVNTTFEDLYFGFAYLAVGEALPIESAALSFGETSSG